MGLEDVTQEIRADAEQEAEAILDEAEEETERIIQEAEERKEEILQEAREEAEREIESLRKRELSSARMDARQTRLAAREEVLEETFQQFRDRVHDIEEDTERDLIADALEGLDVDIGTVIVRDAFEDVAAEHGDVETADVRGVIVESSDGSRRFDMTFDAMADETIAEARQDVASELFD